MRFAGRPVLAYDDACRKACEYEGGKMTTTTELVLTEITDHLATVTLNRPEKLNALNADLLDALPGVLQALAGDKDVRCVVLTGAGRGFCAGGDIGGMVG